MDSNIGQVSSLLWGPSIKNEVFERWSQGFIFSAYEKTALVQIQGGPCAIIASVQAYLLKVLIMETPGFSHINDFTTEKIRSVLIQAICNILMKCKDDKYCLVALNKTINRLNDPVETALEAVEENKMLVDESAPKSIEDIDKGCSSSSTTPANIILNTFNEDRPLEFYEEGDQKLTPEEFHERLYVQTIESIDDVEKYYSDNFSMLSGKFGVLLLLYSVLLTKSLDNVYNELSDGTETQEPLIHTIYGYGSQALINLMLTGRAVAQVFDHEQDVAGLKLKGINQQSDIGFITLMENHQYCTVGSFLKNPKNPIWILGSETHLSVLFSNEKRLVSPETPPEIARRVFHQYDTDGSNFIQSVFLQDVLCALELVSEPEYVEIMRKKLDPESLGIVLLSDFLYEFFPEDQKSVPDTFDLMHYNGISNSNVDCQVKYHKGTAILLESDLRSLCMSNPMLTTLQTKWPTIEISWNDMRTPSLN